MLLRVGNVILERSIKNSMTFLIFFTYVVFILSVIGTSIIKSELLIYLRQVLGFLTVSFVPGYLLFRLILAKCKVTHMEDIKLISHSIGLSLFILMFSGFLLNIIYFIFKFNIKPFSELMLGVCITIVIFILYILNILYVKNKICIIKSFNLSKIVILYLMLPFIAIISIYFINFYNNSLLSLVLIFIISITPLIIVFNKIPENSLPIIIGSISLSLIFLNSMLGYIFRATDNMFEFCLLSKHLSNGFWDCSIYVNFNAMLGVVMTIPYYNVLCNISLADIYRFVVPLISSLIPICLYKAFEEITNSKIAFLSTFFFISIYEFYTWSGLTMKMTTVELFLALILLVLTDNKSINRLVKAILMLIYLASISVSHYGTTYIVMFCFSGSLLTLIILRQMKSRSEVTELPELTLTLVTFFIVFATSWYIYTASSSPFDTMVKIGNSLVKSLIHEKILPKKSYAYEIVAGKLPEYLQILKYLYIISSIFITIGLLKVIIFNISKKKEENIYKFSVIYIILSIFFYISSGSVFLGGLSGAATPDRIYQIMSFILAPFCIIGGIATVQILSFKKINFENALKLFSIFLIIFLLFNTCFFAEVVWKYNVGPVISISKPRILNNGDVYEKEYIDRVSFFKCNIYSAIWLLKHKSKYRIYGGQNANKDIQIAKAILTLSGYKIYKASHIRVIFKKTKIKKKSYIYLTKFNVETNMIKMTGSVIPKLLNLTEINIIKKSCKVYTNGDSIIYFYT